MKKKYAIVTNSKGRRILVINELMEVKKEKAITYEDFDAIFLNMNFFSAEEIKLALQWISPFNCNKCWIKPRFLHTLGKVHIPELEYLTDGMGDTPLEDSITERIEEIFERIQTLKVPRFEVELHSHTLLCLRLCNYCSVRGFLDFSTTTAPGLMMGFTTLFSTLFVNPEMNVRAAMFEFIEKLIDQNCVVFHRHLERVHLCPHCHSPRLLFMECCPKCKRSDIKQESVIHHFRCANVSPESTYEYDGQLRCPKCRQYVRHIGVDYDRPADIYTCNSCGNTFLNADMRVYCRDCGKTSQPSDLSPHDINIYRFTDEGIRAIINTDAVFAFSKEIWNGYTPFDLYLKQIRWFSQSSTPSNAIVGMRFRLGGSGLKGTDLVAFTQDIHTKFYHYNFTTQGGYFYLSHRCREEEIEQAKGIMNKELSGNVAGLLAQYSEEVFYEDNHVFVFRKGDNAEDFIREISKFTPPR